MAPVGVEPYRAQAVEKGAPLGRVDHALLGVTMLLVTFGIVMVYSASAVFAEHLHHNGQFFLVRQTLYAVMGFVALTFFAVQDHRRLRAFTYPMLGLTVVLMLAVVMGAGHSGGGAARWIRLGPINIQPAEIAKLSLIVWLSHSLAKKNEKIRTFSVGFLPHLLVAGFLMLLCLKQPDFGSAVVLLLLTFTLLFVA
ncbi:MAG: FtsW/RodA/SpoVE family cell cycle protein, partial [Deltaproteobacteria bacterium]|nr:FtsW/RodA/SpoVE family cell cycle protein [Deltaproteobacteria bacterium]